MQSNSVLQPSGGRHQQETLCGVTGAHKVNITKALSLIKELGLEFSLMAEQ